MKLIVLLLVLAISVGGYAASACAFGGGVREGARMPSCHENTVQREGTMHQKSVSKALSAHLCCAPCLLPALEVLGVSLSVVEIEKSLADTLRYGEFVSLPLRPPSA